ncbi:unnamed protein product [Paramecium sonneborni]|uniref:Uncharacterized protein n=1 Tax=Paramecium sonneborni TaxID=65129 RepID=A0A8S1NCH2_9CILI|nr:unnamed protein product [Paramecium sonneborni]
MVLLYTLDIQRKIKLYMHEFNKILKHYQIRFNNQLPMFLTQRLNKQYKQEALFTEQKEICYDDFPSALEYFGVVDSNGHSSQNNKHVIWELIHNLIYLNSFRSLEQNEDYKITHIKQLQYSKKLIYGY